MERKLIRHGDSLAIVLDESILREIGANASTTFSISAEGDSVHLKPVRRQDMVAEALEKADERYGRMLKNLMLKNLAE